VDVVVVGAGPAGSALAARLAARGVGVLLLDARAFPREKPCGDCVNPGGVALLERWGWARALRGEVAVREIAGWRLAAAGGPGFAPSYGGARVAWGVRRRDLDAALLRRAVACGARFAPGLRVVAVSRAPDGRVDGVWARGAQGPVRVGARLVVGADGLRSVVAARLGLVRRPPRRRKVAWVAHVPGAADALDGVGELWVARGPGGRGACVVGLAPLGDGSLNVTCVHAPPEGERPASWEAVLACVPEAARRLRGFAREPGLLVSGPFDRPVRRTWVAGALLVGDAAGYYDPFTGAGIYRALRSAELAEPRALEYLATGAPAALAAYGRACRRALRRGRALERLVERVVSRPRAFAYAAALLRRAPAAAAACLRAVGDCPRARQAPR
jgi:flavin-dependent dehydrogenase